MNESLLQPEIFKPFSKLNPIPYSNLKEDVIQKRKKNAFQIFNPLFSSTSPNFNVLKQKDDNIKNEICLQNKIEKLNLQQNQGIIQNKIQLDTINNNKPLQTIEEEVINENDAQLQTVNLPQMVNQMEKFSSDATINSKTIQNGQESQQTQEVLMPKIFQIHHRQKPIQQVVQQQNNFSIKSEQDQSASAENKTSNPEAQIITQNPIIQDQCPQTKEQIQSSQPENQYTYLIQKVPIAVPVFMPYNQFLPFQMGPGMNMANMPMPMPIIFPPGMSQYQYPFMCPPPQIMLEPQVGTKQKQNKYQQNGYNHQIKSAPAKLENVMKKSKEQQKQENMEKLNQLMVSNEKPPFEPIFNRNIKLNIGGGLINFIKQQIQNARMMDNREHFVNLQELNEHFLCRKDNRNCFQTYRGWRDVWNHERFGPLLRQLSKQFFQGEKSHAQDYVVNSNLIKPERKPWYLSKLNKFLIGCQEPSMFTSEFFLKEEKHHF